MLQPTHFHNIHIMAHNSKRKSLLKVTHCQGWVMVKGAIIDAIAEESIKIQNAQIPTHCIGNRKKRDGASFHLTLLTQTEVKSITTTNAKSKKEITIDYIVSKANKDLQLNHTTNHLHLFNMGIGKANAQKSTCYYAILLWPETLRFRRNVSLSNAQFHPHITLGFNPHDIHKADKSLSTLLPTQNTVYDNYGALFQLTQRFSIKKDTQIILNALEILISHLNPDAHKLLLIQVLSYRANVFGHKSRFTECLNDTLLILTMDPYHVPALISQGIAFLAMKRPLEAAETFRFSQKILNLYTNAKEERNLSHAKQRLSFFFGTGPRQDTTANVWIQRIKRGLDQCRKDTLSVALSPRIRISIKYSVNCASGQIPERIHWNDTILPRNFSWVVDGWLCGTSLPKSAEQLKAFEAMNIGLIVTVFDTPLPLLKSSKTNIKCIHLKTENYKAPRLFEAERYIKEAEQCIFVRNKAVLVHCGGGKGRAGTGLACFVIKWGFIFDKLIEVNGAIPQWKRPQKTASEAIQHLQAVRPGSIETKEQEQFIKKYANHLWSKCKASTTKEGDTSNNGNTTSDPTGLKRYPALSDKQITCLKSKNYPEFVILCGVPGSGKTMFCRLIRSLNKQQHDHKMKIVNEWRFANQDALGKKEKVELMVKKWLSAKMGAKIGLIIDRCNVTKKERKHWMEMTFHIKKTVAVYFDIDHKLCKERIQKRQNHQTIQNRSQRSIDKLMNDFCLNLQLPTEKEGFQAVYTIRNTTDLISYACQIFGCLPELVRHFIPTQFFKFPRTPHLWNTGAATRDDIQLDAQYGKLYYGPSARAVVVTEKVDGANLGIALSANYEIQCQHRGSAIVYNSSAEYTKLKDWLDRNSKVLCQILEPQRHILFGEWCQCKHSILYDTLPDYFLVFDLYDRHSNTFVSRAKLERICDGKLVVTKLICKQKFQNKEEIEALMNDTRSNYTQGAIEGLYLKIDDDEQDINVHRCKLVRSEFIQGITEHWIHKKLEYNTIRLDEHIIEEKEEKKREVHQVKTVKRNRDRGGIFAKQQDDLYRARMARSRFTMSIKVLCKKLKLNMDELLNVFVIGSRVWGTATSTSDWDVIVVTKHITPIAKNKNKAFVSVDNIDAYILEQEQWKQELNDHRFVCWLTMFLPMDAIWKNDLKMTNEMFNGKIFADTLLKQIDKDCKKLHRFYTKKKMDKVDKTFIHALRMCEVSKKMIVLLKKRDCSSFVGSIKFIQIENVIRDKRIKLQKDSDTKSNKTSNIWINELREAAKECMPLID
eukprot:378323_1